MESHVFCSLPAMGIDCAPLIRPSAASAQHFILEEKELTPTLDHIKDGQTLTF